MTDLIILSAGGISVTIGFVQMEEMGINDAFKLTAAMSSGNTSSGPNITYVVNLNQIERRFTVDGILYTDPYPGTETALTKKDNLIK